MGQRGPVPKRSEERLGHQTKAEMAEFDKVIVTVDAVTAEVTAPGAPDSWHPTARAWFESLSASGQSRFYEPSDWQVAFLWAEILSKQLNGKGASAMMMAQFNAVQADLLTTEGARRRVRLELQRQAATGEQGDAGSVTLLDDYRDALG